MDDRSEKNSCRFLLFIAAFFLYAFPSSAQQLIFKNIGSQLNLPSYECYNVIQDRKGYIWITTENGLCRYNGTTLKIFNKQNGLPDNGIYFIKENSDGGLRLISASSKIVRFSSDAVIPEKYAAAFEKEMLKNDGQRAYLINETPDGDIINSYVDTYLANRRTGKFTNLTQAQPDKKTIDITVFSKGKHSYFVRNHKISYTKKEKGRHCLNVLVVSDHGQRQIKVLFDSKTEIDSRIKLAEINGTLFLNLQNKLIEITPSLESKIYDMPSKILNLYPDRRNGLWVGLFQKGVRYYGNIRRMGQVKVNLCDYSVSGILMDTEGGIWCSTLEKSVFYCNSVNALSYADIPQLNKLATLLKPVGGKLYVSTAHDNLFVFEGNSLSSQMADKNQNTDYTDIIAFDRKLYLSNKNFTIAIDEFSKKKIIYGKANTFPAYAFDTIPGKLYAVDYTDLFEIKNGQAYRIADFDVQGIRTLACQTPTAFYVGENTGLRKINPVTGQQQKVPGISSPVPKILKASDGRLWIATKGNGLQVMENQKLRRIRFREKHDLFFDLAEDANGTIWASSENSLVSIGKKGRRDYIMEYNTANGILSNDMGRITVYGRQIFVSTIDGLCSVYIDDMINHTLPKLYLDSFTANRVPVARNNAPLVFSYDQNSVSLAFDVLTFKKENRDILLYRFEGRDSTWTGTTENELHFDNLAPDSYKLAVYAVNNDGIKSVSPVYVEFTITKPFWQQLWFILLCIFLSAGILYVLIKKIISTIHAKEKEKTRINTLIAQSQLSALQAQMNPHFIFNAISSIQNYILKNNEKKAYTYLAKFGKLIRMVLNNSRESTLPLFQELDTLQLYVQLEQLRFKDSFEFILDVHEEVDTYTVYLPAMLIQPYLENAIWHGLMNLGETRKGILQLIISLESGFLKIVIEDNGIGRDRANAYKKDALHHSIGMKLTEQRLQTIYKLKEYEGITVVITDLKDASGKASGTKVELLLPLTL